MDSFIVAIICATFVATCLGAPSVGVATYHKLSKASNLDFTKGVEQDTLEFTFDTEGAALTTIVIKIDEEVAAMTYTHGPSPSVAFLAPLSDADNTFTVNEEAAPTSGTLTFLKPGMVHEGVYTITVNAIVGAPQTVSAIRYCDSQATTAVIDTAAVAECKVKVVSGAGCPEGFIYGGSPAASGEVKVTSSLDETWAGTPVAMAMIGVAGADGTFKFGVDPTKEVLTVDDNTPKGLELSYSFKHGDVDIASSTVLAEFDTPGCVDWSNYCANNSNPLPPRAGVTHLDSNLVCTQRNALPAAVTCRKEVTANLTSPAVLTFSCKTPCTLKFESGLVSPPAVKNMTCGENDQAWVDEKPVVAGKWPICDCTPAVTPAPSDAANLSYSLVASFLMALLLKTVV